MVDGITAATEAGNHPDGLAEVVVVVGPVVLTLGPAMVGNLPVGILVVSPLGQVPV